MGNNFFYFFLFEYGPKLFKKNRIEIWTFLLQICFWNQFWTLGSVQLKISKYSYLRIFRLTTFRSGGLKFGKMVNKYALKSPRGVRSAVCKITHL